MKEELTLTKTLNAFTNFVDIKLSDSLKLQNGGILDQVRIAYQTYGSLNESRDNVILVCHALTGNAHAAGVVSESEIINSSGEEFLEKYNKMYLGKSGWWSELIGSGKAIDTDKYFVVCSNVLGSCYSSSGPGEVDHSSGKKFNQNFPDVTVRDMVNAQKLLLESLKINKVKSVVGGSLGGMQVLEWAIMFGGIIDSIIPIATAAAHSAWAMGLNRAARIAIENDPEFFDGDYITQPKKGLILARQIAMQTYKSYTSFKNRFGRELSNKTDSKNKNIFEVESYLDYQGAKLTERFDANAYIYLSRAMDMHDVGAGRGGVPAALQSINCKTLCVGISSDAIYPPEEQREIADNIIGAQYAEIESIHGHDAFLIEFEQLNKIIGEFLNS